MPPKYKSRKRVSEANEYDSDGGFVEDAQISKRAKTTQAAPSKETQTDEEGNEFWEISAKRRIQISKFSGKQMINIREFYEKDGKILPGKKGISLSIEQFSTFVELLPQIEEVLKSKGEEVPRPKYGSPTAITKLSSPSTNDGNTNEELAVDGPVQSGLDKFKYSKKNHEATSDEDDD
ncbi:hypothetical protein MBLNU459_g2720t1 [Dothideomycetes sp. NU459]